MTPGERAELRAAFRQYATTTLGNIVTKVHHFAPRFWADLALIIDTCTPRSRYKVLFLHGAVGLTPEEVVQFAELFGQPNVYPR